MTKLVKNVFWLAIIGVICVIAGYFLVLPRVGRSTPPVSVAGLKGDAKRGANLRRGNQDENPATIKMRMYRLCTDEGRA